MVVKKSIFVVIKVFNHLFKVCSLQLSVSVLSLELGQRLNVDLACVAAVYPFESCVRLEVSHS